MKIYRYELEQKTEQLISIPEGSHILDIQKRGEKIVMWVLVTDKPNIECMIYMYGTGEDVPEDRVYVATVQYWDFVGHFFTD